MRNFLTQDHATNLRDLLLNYKLDYEGSKVIDFTFGKGGLWKTDYKYKLTITKCDAKPIKENCLQKNLLSDDYSELGLHQAGVLDLPYKYGKETEVFNHEKPESMQKQGKNSWGKNPQFATNLKLQDFLDRVRALNKIAGTCLEKNALLFVKIMDIRYKTKLVINHKIMIDELANFECIANFVYLAAGAHTWKHEAENMYGFWQVFRLVNTNSLQPTKMPRAGQSTL